MLIEDMAADVSVAEPETVPDVAVMVDTPTVSAFTIPFESSKLLTDATPPFDELHTAEVVMS
jgi:hypothetical protein